MINPEEQEEILEAGGAIRLSRYEKEFKNTFRKADIDEFTAARQHFIDFKTYTREPHKSKAEDLFWKEEI